MAVEGNHCHGTATSHKTGPTKPSYALLSHLATMFSFTPLRFHTICVLIREKLFSLQITK